MDRIAGETGLSRATVGRILARCGLNRWRDLEPSEPVRRYERAAPGELIHLDIKKLGKFVRTGHRITCDPKAGKSRGAGWEFVHVSVDDHSRLAFSQVLESERREDAVAFLRAAVTWYRKMGIAVERVMTDNGSCYRAKAFNTACKALGLRHIYTRPYTPRPMERRSASTSLPGANGPMGAPIKPRNNERPSGPIGCTTTIGIAPTPG